MKKFKHNQSGVGTVGLIVIVATIGLVGFIGWRVYSNNSKAKIKTTVTKSTTNTANTTPQKTLAKGDFGNDGDFGTFQAEGYAQTVKVDDTTANCGMMNPDVACPKMDATFFVVVRTSNPHILEYIKKSHLESSPNNSFQMGCTSNGEIKYTNSSDNEGYKEFTISKADSSKLSSATADKPIVVVVSKQKLTYGKDAPTCYSDFTSYKIIN